MLTRVQAHDGSVKFVFSAGGGRVFEAAFFHVPGRERPYIACVSTQVGCAVRCGFCATRESGLIRQLTAAEILDQITAVIRLAIERGASESQIEVSFMGMGEPLANRDALLEAIRTTAGLHPRMSRVSVSTVGPAPRILDFADAARAATIPVHLQISLHATCDEVRRTLIPGVKDRIPNLLAAGESYSDSTGDYVCLNYLLLDGINDSDDDAVRLSQVSRKAFYVKLTHLNALPDLPPWARPSAPSRFTAFADRLAAAGVGCKIFQGDGLDINASCGQLAARSVAIYRSAACARTA